MSPEVPAAVRRLAGRTAPVRWRTDAKRWRAVEPKLWRPPGHFYSPITDPDEIAARADRVFPTRETALIVPGVDLRLAAQHVTLDALEPLQEDLDLSVRARSDRRYHTDNDSYGSGDGLFLSLLLRHLRPSRLVELGGGHSTACTLDARDRWLPNLSITLVEPFPDVLGTVLREGDWATVTHLRQGTQDVDLAVFEALDAGDVLFVDSTHVVKTGSDVGWIFAEVLPRLKPGVWIHFHDIFPRFEYPADWVNEGRSWNEAYLLRAFLQYNADFRIELWPNLLRALYPDDVLSRFPLSRDNGGGAIWLSRAPSGSN